ncbi:MAG: hypothetical protein IPN90_12285 [Elusimicrobia bacterium]|nr:hypothetical protein [Elusimicrobiota bacterium]
MWKRHGKAADLVVSARRGAMGLAVLGMALFVVHSLVARWQWERDAVVELCVDGAEIESLTDHNDESTWRLLETVRESGVSSVAVYWDPTRPLSDLMGEWAPRVPDGMSLTLRPEPVPFSDWARGWPRTARPLKEGPPVRNVLFSGLTVMGYPDLSLVKEWLAVTDSHLPWVEFGRQRGMAALQAAFANRVVRAHSLTEEEMFLASPSSVVGRLRRAVRERGARFLYVRLLPGFPRAENEAFVARLAGALHADGYRLGSAVARYGDWPAPLVPLSTGLRQFLAFCVATGIPLASFFWALRRRSVVQAVLGLAGGAVAAGLLVAALLATPSFALGFSVFRGVKLALLLPLGMALFSLYRGDEIRHLLQENVTVGRLVLGLFVIGSVAYFVLRIGHGTVADASGMELLVRGHLETLLGVRPRFKEFLIGHPLLWFGFYLRLRLGEGRGVLPLGRRSFAQALRFFFHDARPFLLAGFIAPLSIVNTFCHAHTPLGVSLVRTFHGVWMGACWAGS